MWWIEVVVILFMLAIVYCLGSGLYYLIKPSKTHENVAKALTWRITLSIILFVLLIVGHAMGWITAHGVS